VKDIEHNFKFPNVNNFSELSIEEKEKLREFFQDSAKMMLESFKEIYHFNSCFRPIYNKYKHVMSEFAGVYGIDKANYNVQSHVYVRQKTIDRQNNPNYSVSLIPLSIEAIQYFEKIGRVVWTLLMFLIDNQLLSFANEGKDFIPRNLFMPEKWEKQEINQIMEKIHSYCVPTIQSILKVNPPTDAELQIKINESFKTDYLYVMKRDILDVEFLKDSKIERSDNSKLAENSQKTEDFEIIDIASSNEVWSTYQLIDGTILKIRDVLLKAIKLPHLDEKGNPIFNISSKRISVAFPSKSILGKETAPCTQEELHKSIIDNNMKFEVIQEPWNEYILKDGTNLQIKAILTAVSKTSKFDHYGEPIYLTTRKLNLEVKSSNQLSK
jgi:hypothetical protein